MASGSLLVFVISASVLGVGCNKDRKSWTRQNDDIARQEIYKEDIGSKYTAIDGQPAEPQHKRKSLPIGPASNDVGRLSSSVRSHNTHRTIATFNGNDDFTPNSQMLSLLLDLSRNMAAMRDVINDLQNQFSYRQLKRLLLQQGRCNGVAASGSQLTSSITSPGYQIKKPEKSGKMLSLVKSASLLVDRPQSDQQQQLKQLAKVSPSQQLTVNGTNLHQQRCPDEFTYSAEFNSCYRLVGDRTTWRSAREKCRGFSADLASVNTALEQRYLNERARHNPDTKHCDFWIGLVRGRGSADVESPWHWIGDHGNGRSPEYTNWNVNEPNNANSYEHCTQMLWVFNWRWNDANCNYGNACYICQAKPRNEFLGEKSLL